MTTEVRVEREKCKGYGKCAQLAPATFSLDAEKLVVLGDAAATAGDVLLRAAKACPYRVITLIDSERGQVFPPVKSSA